MFSGRASVQKGATHDRVDADKEKKPHFPRKKRPRLHEITRWANTRREIAFDGQEQSLPLGEVHAASLEIAASHVHKQPTRFVLRVRASDAAQLD